MAPPRRNVSSGQNFESFQTAAADAARILMRNINAEWQKLKKYKELADAKIEENISCQEHLRHLHENKSIIEKQLMSTERRTESLKNSHAELKRSFNNIRRQEDKASRDLNEEKQMLDEKLAYYQAKWREQYESRYANKPLIQEFEKTKNALANKREELTFLKSELHECKAEIFKAKCERCKRNAEESGFYPLQSFIIRVASIRGETMKLENEEGQLLNEIAVLQQNINNKDKLAQNVLEVEKTKNQSSAELGNVRESIFFKKVPEESMKRKERETCGSIPQKIIRTKEYSILDKFITKKSKPIQGVVAQTSVIQKRNEGFKEGIQEETIRNRMGKLKLYTPQFSSPPDMLSKNFTSDSNSKEIRQQSDDSLVSENCQTLYDKGDNSNQKGDLQMRPIGSKNSEATPIKSSNIDAFRTRLKEITDKTLQNIQKADSGQRYKSFLEEKTVQSDRYVPHTLQNFKEKSKMKETNDHIPTKPTKYGEPMENSTIETYFDIREKENYLINKADSTRTVQELFTNSEKEMQFAQKSSTDILKKMPDSYMKPTRFQKEINSPKVLREFYEGGKEMRSINETNLGKAQGPCVTNEKRAISYNEINLSPSSSGSLRRKDKSFKSFTEMNSSRATSSDEEGKHEDYDATTLEILTKHHAYGNAQSLDNIRGQQFPHNELTEDIPMLENVDENLKNISKHQNMQLTQHSKTSSISEKMLQEPTYNMDEEMQDINEKQQSVLMTSHENKNSLPTSSNVNEEPMDTNDFQDMQNVDEDNIHDKEHMTEDTVHEEFENISKQKYSENISIDMEENQVPLKLPNSSVVNNTDESKNLTHENDLEDVIRSKNILPTSAISNVAYSNSVQTSRGFGDNQSKNLLLNSASVNVPYSKPSQVLQGFGDDRIKTSLNQDTSKIQGVSGINLVKPREETDESNEVNMQEIETSDYTHESQNGKPQLAFQLNAEEPDEISNIKYHEEQSSGNSELIENGVAQNGVVEAGIYPYSSKSTISNEGQFYSSEFNELSSKLQPNFRSPTLEEPKTPVPQDRGTVISPFDFEKHVKILDDLKKTPTFVYQTRQMYKGGNESSPKEAQSKMPQEPIEIGKDIFDSFSFFEGPTAGQENSSKTPENEQSKTEESGFLSFALEDYLDDSADSPVTAGKEKSLFSFSSDSPKGGVKSPQGFFPLFGADTQDTSKETKSGFLLNFGSNDKAKSPEDGSSFKFLF